MEGAKLIPTTPQVKEVGMWKERINSDDVFVLDAGLKILQFNGRNANKDEQMKGAQYCAKLRSERPKAKMEVSDEEVDGTRLIMKSLRDGGPPKEENIVRKIAKIIIYTNMFQFSHFLFLIE